MPIEAVRGENQTNPDYADLARRTLKSTGGELEPLPLLKAKPAPQHQSSGAGDDMDLPIPAPAPQEQAESGRPGALAETNSSTPSTASAARPATARAPRRRTAAKKTTQVEPSPLSVRVESFIKKRIRELAILWDMSPREVVLQAVSSFDVAQTTELVAQWQDRILQSQPRNDLQLDDDLFEAPQAKIKSRADDVPLVMRLSAKNQEGLSRRAAETGAAGRGQLIEAVINAAPDTRPGPRK